MNTSKRCRLELRPARWLLPQLLSLAALAAVALALSRLPGWISLLLWIAAALTCAAPLRRLCRLHTIELVEPDLLNTYTRGSTAPSNDVLSGWQRLGPWLLLHRSEGGRVPLWLPGLSDESRQALLRTLARCRPPRSA